MSDRRSYIALDWVNEEIVETLNQAIDALDGFVCNSEDVTKLRFSLTYVHQVAGSLKMIELLGASLFTRDIETLIGTILENDLPPEEQVKLAHLVKKALSELSAYVVKVGQTHEDTPKDLLTIINEVRAANKQDYMSEADVFNPDLGAAKETKDEKPAIAVDDFNELIRKLRQTFQRGLIGVVREQDLEANYLIISKVCASLNKVSSNTASAPLWKIAYAIADHLLQRKSPADIESKKALKQIDNQIKHLEESGIDALLDPPEPDLLRVLLYSVATAEPITDAIRELRAAYQLEDTLSKEASDIAEKVFVRIKSAISKDIEFLQLANKEQNAKILSKGLERLLNTFGLLSQQENLDSLVEASDAIRDRVLADQPILSDMQAVESALWESSELTDALTELITDKTALIDQYKQYINDCRAGLDAIKEQVIEYVADQSETSNIDSLPVLLDEQINRLNISPFHKLVSPLEAAKQYMVENVLGADSVPELSLIEALADIVSSVDYYLECANAESQENLDAIVSTANESVAALGLSTDSDTIPTLDVDADAEIPTLETEVPMVGAESVPTEDVPTLEASDKAEEATGETEDEGFVLGDDVDEEILEIFVEEGREVVEHILEYLPQLKKDYDNEEALLEIRRSFHTLKGSGRMVGAMHVGDFAWSVERMLNNVRDGMAKVTDNCIAVVEEATSLVPGFMDALESAAPISRRVIHNIILKADAEWEGKPPPVLEEVPEKVAKAPVQSAPEEVVDEVAPVAEVEETQTQESIDIELLDIFIAEAEVYISMFVKFLEDIDPGYEDVYVTSDLQRALHTLKGSAYMAGVIGMATLVTPLESFVKDLNNFQTAVDAEILALFVRASELLKTQLGLLKQHSMKDVEGVSAFITELNELHSRRIETQETKAASTEESADKYTVLLSEALECMSESADLISEWQSEGISKDRQQELVIYVARLCETASKANYPEVAALAGALASYYQEAIDSRESFDHDFFELANKGHDALDDMMDMIAAQQVVKPATELIAELGGGAHPVAALASISSLPKLKAEDLHLSELREQLLAADEDTLEIFAEEAGELLEVLEVLVSDWLEDHSDTESLSEIKRILTTIKGGARLTELSVLGDLTHEYESRIENAESDNQFDGAFFTDVEALQGKLSSLVEYVVSGNFDKEIEEEISEPQEVPVAELDEEEQIPLAKAEEEEIPVAEVEEEEIPLAEAEEEEIPVAEVEEEEIPLAEAEQVEPVASSQESVKNPVLVALAQECKNADEDTLEIFLEEVEELANDLEEAVNNWIDDHDQTQYVAELKRVLHTIKGGARMTELASLGNLAHDYESMIEAAEANEIFDDAFFEHIQSFQDDLQQMVDFVLSGANPDNIPEVLVDVSPASEGTLPEEVIAEGDESGSQQAESEPESETVDVDKAAQEVPNAALVALSEQCQNADADTLEIFLEEAEELANSLEETVNEWLDNREDSQHAAELKRVLHTIKGGARMTELSALGDLAHDYESMIETSEANGLFDDAFFDSMQSYQDQVHRMVDFILSGARLEDIPPEPVVDIAQAPQTEPEPAAVTEQESVPVQETVEEIEEESSPKAPPQNIALLLLAEQCKNADEDTLEIFLEEASELSASLEEAVIQWLDNHDQIEHAAELKRVLHTIKGGARMTELSSLGDLAHDYESMIEAAEAKKQFDDEFFDRVQTFQDQLQSMVDFVLSGARVEDVPAAQVPEEAAVSSDSQQLTDTVSDAEAEVPEVLVELSEDIDEELVELFVEEAKEQVEGIEEAIAEFLKDTSNLEPLEELKRLLHTLKGGARLAGVKVVGDLSHDMETFIINGEREKKVTSDEFVDEMQAYHDKLSKNINAIKIASESTETEKPKEDKKKAPVESNVIPIRPDVDPTGVSQAAIDATRTFIENFNKEQQRTNRDPVKITPEQLETLINLAGENSIGHSRVEEQISELAFTHEEMDSTVDRLHGQLRRLEIETEAQIVFRQEQVVSEGQESFDPLEMDRYTHMQQLSKSLIEAASDLDDISATFTNKMRDMETLLVQQSRINTELQENLMRCQMVPFSRMVPRLRRIVRQVAQELGKKIEFNVENAEGEMDRTILERMVAPLEHMLRNAVDHGIEMPDVRKKAGKKPQGSITLALSREGGEVVLTLRDNGAGVNIAAVRKKAIERGLIAEDVQLSDHEISQFILHAGFSTAEKVTQISGRGVGMDVVHSEIKQMGGSVDIHSVQGEGSLFTVRLPFTVSVNRALMVCIGNDTYAIPLNTIEGIVRVSPYELEAYYQPDAPMFEYAGQSYNLRYMGTLLYHGHNANLEGLTTPLPVVLIRSSDYTVAVQVDRLLGSQEVVVKSLGPQFGMVEGLSGATVLGDGSVVIILDMLAMIRKDASRGVLTRAEAAALEAYEPEVEEKVTTVMVTDDSVTVRKVTSRFLERYGLNVILAKDGMDAITQLQDMDASELPDIMLLDIEMPRMDGFEVLSRVRHNEKLQHIPICMITSRTGEKHRERAISLGASRYLGKPFQESELLQTISELTGAEVQQA